MNNQAGKDIEFMFNEGMKKEAVLILEGIYNGIKNYQEVSDMSPTKSSIFLIVELENANYIKRNAGKTFELCEKGLTYLISNKIIEPKKEVQPQSLEKEAVISS